MKVQDIILKENNDLIKEGLKGSLAKKGAEKFKSAVRAAKDKYKDDLSKATTKVDKAKARVKYEKSLEAARKAAKSKLGALPTAALNALNIAFTAEFLYEWYTKLVQLEDEYKAFLAGDKETGFGNATPEEGYQLAQERRRKLLGEATIVVLANLGVASKASQFLGFIFGKGGKLVGSSVAGRLGGEAGEFLAKLPFSISQKIFKMIEGGPGQKLALNAFIRSEEGKKFLEWITFGLFGNLVGLLGFGASEALEYLNKGLEAAGVDAPDAIKTKITPPPSDPNDPATGQTYDPAMSVQRDPKNPKILYVDRVAITDAEGYQDVGNATLADIKNRANILGRADPTAGIPKKPGKDYNY